MKKFRRIQINKACDLSPVGKSNWLRKEYCKAMEPRWSDIECMAMDLIWKAICKPHERKDSK